MTGTVPPKRDPKTGPAWALKRLLDILLSLGTLLFLSPLFLFLALLVRVKLGSPVLFRQERAGRNGKVFCLVKFRTMTDARDENGQLLPDAVRLTSFGKFLRSSSLDELPELVNVLRGEMSLVGPRPLLVRYLPRYSPEQARRHEVLPGLTGWAQVNGRNAVDWDDRFRMDVWYVDNWSLALDLRIILMTVKKVVVRDGITAEGSATMTEFEGSKTSS